MNATRPQNQVLQRAIEVKPGQEPTHETLRNGSLGSGGKAVLYLTNWSSEDNTLEVRLEDGGGIPRDCFKVIGRGSRGQIADSLPIPMPGKGDEMATVTVEVPRGPRVKAGIYSATLSLTDTLKKQRRLGDPYSRVAMKVVVRSDTTWTVRAERIHPIKPKAGYFFKRRHRYELVFENRGNDWIYLDIEARPEGEVEAEFESRRIAIPPGEREERPGVRTVRLNLKLTYRQWRGQERDFPIGITIKRLGAPSVTEAYASTGQLDLSQPVRLQPTNDEHEMPREHLPIIKYRPVIIDHNRGFFALIIDNIRQILYAVPFVLSTFYAAELIYKHVAYKAMKVSVTARNAPLGEKFKIAGSYLVGSDIYLFEKNNPSEEYKVEYKYDPLTTLRSGQNQTVDILLDKDRLRDLDGKEVRILVRRGNFLPMPAAWRPSAKSDMSVLIGGPKAVEVPPVNVNPPADARPAGKVILTGEGFGTERGEVLLDGSPVATIAQWKDDAVEFNLPEDIAVDSYRLQIVRKRDKKQSKTVVLKVVEEPAIPLGSDGTEPFESTEPDGGESEEEITAPGQGEPIAPAGEGSGNASAQGEPPPHYGDFLRTVAGDEAAAQRLTKTLRAQDPDPEVRAMLAFAFAARGDSANAEKILRRLSGSVTGRLAAYVALAQGRVAEEGDAAAANNHYRAAIDQGGGVAAYLANARFREANDDQVYVQDLERAQAMASLPEEKDAVRYFQSK